MVASVKNEGVAWATAGCQIQWFQGLSNYKIACVGIVARPIKHWIES